MSKQPYFFKRQFVCIFIEIILLLILFILRVTPNYRYICEIMLFITVSETFLPYILKRFNFTESIDAIFYYLPFYYHIIYIGKFETTINYNLRVIIGAIILTILLLLSNYSDYKKAIKGMASRRPLNKGRFISLLISYLIAIVAEEVVFRAMLLNICGNLTLVASVLLSATLFTFSHYINRWANVFYKVKNYIYIFSIGIVLAVLYVYTKSIMFCFLVHLIYNSSEYIVLIKRLLKREEGLLFDDY